MLDMYVIYKNPSDYPGMYVLRKWAAGPGKIMAEKEPMIVTEFLEEARQKVPRGLYMAERTKDDDPAIYEVWL